MRERVVFIHTLLTHGPISRLKLRTVPFGYHLLNSQTSNNRVNDAAAKLNGEQLLSFNHEPKEMKNIIFLRVGRRHRVRMPIIIEYRMNVLVKPLNARRE